MFKTPILTVDAVILTLVGDKLMVGLMRRSDAPCAGQLALPGGYVHADPEAGKVDASTGDAMLRILRSKLGFRPSHLEQVCTASGPKRDPRGWSASVVHLALHQQEVVQPLVDAGKLEMHELIPTLTLKARDLAFDHLQLVDTALARLKAKASYSTIVAHLLPKVFRMSDLQAAYEIVTGVPTNKDNFRRKVLDEAVLVEAELLRHSGGRPAQGYSLREELAILGRQIS
ncbi:8-oxo-dGTP diphosphatase [Paucibacter oligotrophus]|uniref:8-oxo-dGTP diphosphatase n=1 Tax=Roseateles oligotrophus TaxID=1769250 RepID=A0A840LH19_9BURK|nr:NUDIX hydrolase [Roseateles oligotrophus]MBB4845903.1 8-oxo-dGTP diphosphatase [Roseateles oligotrophus]